jgi:hypothetical protein
MTDTAAHRRGRPALVDGEVSISVTVRMSLHDYDAASAKARQDRTSLPEIVRRALAQYLAEVEVLDEPGTAE